MKTAEEWHERMRHGFTTEAIKQIQLDAYKAGMAEASEICKSKIVTPTEIPELKTRNRHLESVSIDILSARDKKEKV